MPSFETTLVAVKKTLPDIHFCVTDYPKKIAKLATQNESKCFTGLPTKLPPPTLSKEVKQSTHNSESISTEKLPFHTATPEEIWELTSSIQSLGLWAVHRE